MTAGTDPSVPSGPAEPDPQVPDPAAGTGPGPGSVWYTRGAALAIAVLGTTVVVGALSYGAGTVAAPGAGLWPLAIGAFLAVGGMVLAVTAATFTDTEAFTGQAWKVVLGTATMVGFAAVLTTVGFEIPTLLVAFVWLRVLGRESWWMSAVLSIGMVVTLYVIFVGLLSTPIPHMF